MRTYEELTGGFGQAIAFRARRQLAKELLREQASTITIAGDSFQLYDMAMNGVSFLAPEGPHWRVDDVLEVDIRVHETSAYVGRARVAREEQLYGQRRVGLQLLSGFLDLHEMQRLDEEQALMQDLVDGPERIIARIPVAYREALLATVHFAAFYQRILDSYEARRRDAHAIAEEREALARRAIVAIRPRWHTLRTAAAEAAATMKGDRKALSAAKTATETLLTPLIVAAPILHRAYTKPLGYAGDFSVMLHIYKDGFEGDTAFGQVFHKLACEEPLSAGVRTRKDLVKQLTTREHARMRDAGEQLRAMSLGCGPAREVVEYLAETELPAAGIRWTLIDQEERALSVAYHDVLRAIDARHADCTAQCLYLSFEQLIRDPLAVRGEPQDFIYCVGMFDYLNRRRAQALLLALYERLSPGGLLAIGNALGPNNHAWMCEFACDWTLIYRDRDDLRQLAEGAVNQGATLELQSEASRAYDFILLRKP